jgi:hypothetical protein
MCDLKEQAGNPDGDGTLEEGQDGFPYAAKAFAAQYASDRAALGDATNDRFLGPPAAQSMWASDLTEMGWALVVPAGKAASLPEPLQELRRQRTHQMDRPPYKVFEYQPDESVAAFLKREGDGQVGVGAMLTSTIPYYLCLWGSPEEIPWSFQAALDSEYAVGRIHFDDPDDLTSYVNHLLKRDLIDDGAGPPLLKPSQMQTAPKPPFSLFVPEKELSGAHKELVPVINTWTDKEYASGPEPLQLLKQSATSNALVSALREEDRGGFGPRLLVSIGHGLEPHAATVDALERFGALACEDGVSVSGAHITSPPPVVIPGDIWYAFACFSAGGEATSWWPATKDEWYSGALPAPRVIAPRPFVAKLPQKALAAGLAAFAGHVSKSWDYSYLGITRGSVKPTLFLDPLQCLVRGQRIGHAFDIVAGVRAARLGETLDSSRQAAEAPNATKDSKASFVYNYVAWNDARYTVLLGDPAARLRPK